MKKFILALIVSLITIGHAYAEDTDLRTMFQNNEAVIYELNIRTFNAKDSNGNGIIELARGDSPGSFLNAVERLDELKDLGINTLHVMPITPVGKIKALGTAGSLYALSDFTKINMQLSDIQSELPLKQQAKIFIDECHKRGIKVIVDLPSCGSYDLFIDRPDLFVQNKDGSPVIPADWADVRLFNVPDNHQLFNSDIFTFHKIFVKNMLDLKVDGIRADVATLKPYIFWKELIKDTREKNPNFLFLAEASENWTKPATDRAYFTDYKKLLEAGFDGYYGNYFDLKNWKTSEQFISSVQNQRKVLKKYKDKKSVIGSFDTHDEVSPLLVGGEGFSKIIVWLNATLPLNPYYVDGFLQANDYMYDYSNKKAPDTYTDDQYYYVHQGQLDIFNFSAKLDTLSDFLIKEHKIALDFRNKYKNTITSGKFVPLNTDNNKIYAFQRVLGNEIVTVIINRNLVSSEDTKISIRNIKKSSKFDFVVAGNRNKLNKSTFSAKLKPAEIVVFAINN